MESGTMVLMKLFARQQWRCKYIVTNVTNFPGGSDGKEFACNVGDPSVIPESGRFPREGNGNSLQYSYLGNTMERRAWWATVHRSKWT